LLHGFATAPYHGRRWRISFTPRLPNEGQEAARATGESNVSQELASKDIARLIDRLDLAVQLGSVETITTRIKEELEDASRGPLALPKRFLVAREDCYARRLLHRNEALGYTAVVMTWGPGQETPLHDHAGMWCVECVVQGELNVSQFDLSRQDDTRYYFDRKKQVRAGVGDAGCLIPPYEYHILGNALPQESTVTLHVYGGEMDHCHLFRKEQDWWERERRELDYYPH
jgi:predicted metal-dependent enzyme (double-stranded beta helix superfamily)